ncbi:MAG: galactokinase [Verrucomicrobiota bacterium]|nr:galactokinase [Verrucomicrobiota bacterium]
MSPASAFAPGRVELLGNHTDYNQGVVLAAAIDRGLTVAGIARMDDNLILTSRSAGSRVHAHLRNIFPHEEAPWANYPLGVIEQFSRAGFVLRGFDAEVSGDVPLGAGLSSSAALEVATAGLLMKLHELRIAPLEVAKLCQRAENDFVGVRSGLLDQVTSIFGKADHLVYLDCQSEEVRTIPFPIGYSLVIAETGVKHSLVASLYNERRDECAAAADALGAESLREVTPDHLEIAHGSIDETLYRRAAHIVGENDRVWRAIHALEVQDAVTIGALMNASHESSRTNFENSTPALDELVAIARSLPGVLGSRLTGGGFGGATVTLATTEEAARVAEQIRDRYAETRDHAPATFVCRIADGAMVYW